MTRLALVTGASRGIGALLADALSADGWGVVRGSSALVDVTDPEAVQGWVEEVLSEHGQIDLLINNAGVIDDEVPLEESDPTQWWRTVEVDVLGPYLLTRAVLPSMLAAGSGRVINVNSGSGTRAGEVATAYHVAKTALARLTGSTHLSGQGRGVTAFDLAPGVVRTDMTKGMASHRGRAEWTDPDAVVALVRALASGRLDHWSGRMVRAGADDPEVLAELRPDDGDRTLTLRPYGDTDPLR